MHDWSQQRWKSVKNLNRRYPAVQAADVPTAQEIRDRIRIFRAYRCYEETQFGSCLQDVDHIVGEFLAESCQETTSFAINNFNNRLEDKTDGLRDSSTWNRGSHIRYTQIQMSLRQYLSCTKFSRTPSAVTLLSKLGYGGCECRGLACGINHKGF